MAYAMKSLMFPVAVVISLAGCSPTIKLSASPGETPGITMGPFTSGSASATATITAESVDDFAGTVTLRAHCCHEVVSDHWVPLDGQDKFVWGFSQGSLNVQAKGSASATLNLSINALPGTNSPSVLPGKYLMEVIADDQAGTIKKTTNVGVKVLLAPGSEPRPSCMPSPVEVLPLSGVLNAEIAAAEENPRKRKLVIAVGLTTGPDVWRWTIEDGTVGQGVARIVLKNNVGWEKEVSTGSCTSASLKSARVPGGNTGEIQLYEGIDNTFVFRKPVGVGLQHTWITVAVFAEPAFWTVFGGRTHTFEWLKD